MPRNSDHLGLFRAETDLSGSAPRFPTARSPNSDPQGKLGIEQEVPVPKKIAPDSTIATVWPHLVHQRSYVAGVLNKVRLCNKAHGNAFVKIGVTGSGQKPCYRVFYLEADGSETIFGSYWDMHDTLENEHALNTNWSIAAMSYEEVHALMIEKHTPPAKKVI